MSLNYVVFLFITELNLIFKTIKPKVKSYYYFHYYYYFEIFLVGWFFLGLVRGPFRGRWRCFLIRRFWFFGKRRGILRFFCYLVVVRGLVHRFKFWLACLLFFLGIRVDRSFVELLGLEWWFLLLVLYLCFLNLLFALLIVVLITDFLHPYLTLFPKFIIIHN